MTDQTIVDLTDFDDPDKVKRLHESINKRLYDIEEKQDEDWKIIKPLRWFFYAVVGGLGLAISGITGAYVMGVFAS